MKIQSPSAAIMAPPPLLRRWMARKTSSTAMTMRSGTDNRHSFGDKIGPKSRVSKIQMGRFRVQRVSSLTHSVGHSSWSGAHLQLIVHFSTYSSHLDR